MMTEKRILGEYNCNGCKMDTLQDLTIYMVTWSLTPSREGFSRCIIIKDSGTVDLLPFEQTC